MKVYYVDGAFVPAEEADIPVTDLAIGRGYGVFDFMRTYGGKIFQLEAHMARLERSAELILLDLPWARNEIMDIIMETVARNDFDESGIKVIVTGGGGDGFAELPRPRLLVLVDEMYGYPASYYTEGIDAITVRDERYLPEAKSINYIPAIVAARHAKAAGVIDALYLDSAGYVLEATRSNLFVFAGDTLVTPREGILPGITRGLVIDLARDRFKVEVRALFLDELYGAAEAFITSTSKEIMPLVAVDGRRIGDGQPRARIQTLAELFKKSFGVR